MSECENSTSASGSFSSHHEAREGNPLDYYRQKASFDVTTLKNLLFGEEIVEFLDQVSITTYIMCMGN